MTCYYIFCHFMERFDYLNIMQYLEKNIISLYGASGKQWLKDLPRFLKQREKELHIKIHRPFDSLTYNYVAPVTLVDASKAYQEAVFKCGVPNVELNSEVEALKYFAGNGCIKLLKCNTRDGWLLLERLVPGEKLLSIKDDDLATKIAAQVMLKLWRTVDKKVTTLPTVAKWLQAFDRLYQQFNGETGPFPKNLVDRAVKLAKELLQSSGEQILLHGDLQHYNILSATHDSWLAIDPKGVIGEREFEIGALMKNPAPLLSATSNLKDLFLRRIDIVVAITNLDRQRVIAWSFIMAMLSAGWFFEGSGKYDELLIRCAENLVELL